MYYRFKNKHIFHFAFGAFILCLGVVGAVSYSLFNNSTPQESASAAGTIYTVTNLNSTGSGSFADMLNQAANNPGQDTVVFASNLSGVINAPVGFVIYESVIINGIDQQANPVCPNDFVPRITLKGTNQSTLHNGIELWDNNNVIAGLNLVDFANPTPGYGGRGGISVGPSWASSDNNVIKCNVIGTEVNQTNPNNTQPSTNREGIVIYGSNNTIGGPSRNDRNVISGNQMRAVAAIKNYYNQCGTNNIIQNNYIGTDITGEIGVGNNVTNTLGAISMECPGNTLKNNVISGNNQSNVVVLTEPAERTKIIGNDFGLSASGNVEIGNRGSVIRVESDNNIIGGIGIGEANKIVKTTQFTPIVVTATGNNNSFLKNIYYKNKYQPISLSGTSPADNLDVDTGANNGQNKPVITSNTVNLTDITVNGTLNSEANKSYRIELYVNDNGNQDVDAKTFVNAVDINTDNAGNATWTTTIPVQYEDLTLAATATEFITATSSNVGTQISGRFYMNTSEFAFYTPPTSANPTISKSHDKQSGANLGDTVTYSISYKNKTNNPLTNVVITDVLNNDLQYVANSCTGGCSTSGQTLTWNIGTLPVGNTVYTHSFQVVVNPNLVTGIDDLPNSVNFASIERSANYSITLPILNNQVPYISKSHDKPSGTSPGSTVTYSISYKNKTNNPLTNVVITDVLNNDLQYVANSCTGGCSTSGQTLTWNIGTLPVGNTVYTHSFQVVVNPGTTLGSIPNTIELDANELTLQSTTVQLSTVPVVANTYVVINNQDKANINDPAISGSLRDMINQANASAGPDVIAFNLPNGSTTIDLNFEIEVNDTVTIDGSTQPGFSGLPVVEIKGSANDYNGIILNSNSNVIKHLVFNNFRDTFAPAITSITNKSALIIDSSFNTVIASYFGTDITGTIAVPNDIGIRVTGANNTIGGENPGEGNLISGNEGDGLYFDDGAGLNVQGNLIGVDKTGTVALGNGENGIYISNAVNSYIGGTSIGSRNIISANVCRGLTVDQSSNTISIRNNYIGLDITGNVDLGNYATGIDIEDNSGLITIGDENGRNIIAGTKGYATNAPVQCRNPLTPTTANISGNAIEISSNNGQSITVKNNYVGTNASGTVKIANIGSALLLSNVSNMSIGGSNASHRNILSGSNSGIQISGTSNTLNVRGNFIGTDVNGNNSISNNVGIIIAGTPQNNIIGGVNPGEGNVISGNTINGIEFNSGTPTNFTIQGNIIGLNSAGNTALPNDFGVSMFESATNNTFGGSDPNARNVISGNLRNAFFIQDSANNNTIQNNFIGTNIDGTVNIGNGSAGGFTGVFINTSGNSILDNTIVGSTSNGLSLSTSASNNRVQGNFIGTNTSLVSGMSNTSRGITVSGNSNLIGGVNSNEGNTIMNELGLGIRVEAAGQNNSILRNKTFNNSTLGIDLAGDGITANDTGDSDTGANNLQNYPTITSITNGTTDITVNGTLNSESNKNYRIELYANDVGFNLTTDREGKEFLTAIDVTTNGSGNINWTTTIPLSNNGKVITSTATEYTTTNPGFGTLIGGRYYLNTSEFGDTNVAPPCSLVVTNNANSGAGSLREAVNCANTDPDTDTVYFNITGSNIISISSPITATEPIIINGIDSSSNPACPNNYTPAVRLRAGNGFDINGLVFTDTGNTIAGLQLGRFSGIHTSSNPTDIDESAITFTQSSGSSTVKCNWIGSDGATYTEGNRNGIHIDGADYIVVGGSTPNDRNIISGNLTGVQIQSFHHSNAPNNNTIIGNYIGTNPSGTVVVDGFQQYGVLIHHGENNVVGGPTPNLGNLISGTFFPAIALEHYNYLNFNIPLSNNSILGNYIGTDASGQSYLAGPNSDFIWQGTASIFIQNSNNNTISNNKIMMRMERGIELDNASSNKIQTNTIDSGPYINGSNPHILIGVNVSNNSQSNLIGGINPAEGNVIINNASNSVRIQTNSLKNAILGNSLHNNNSLGLDLAGNGITPNDTGDSDTGANNLQNYPTITGITPGVSNIAITGTLNSEANKTYRIELFANDNGFNLTTDREGKEFITSLDVTTDGSGNVTWNTTVPLSMVGKVFTSTATEYTTSSTAGGTLIGGRYYLNTSEFGDINVQSPTPDLTINKSHDKPSGVGYNDPVSYTVTYENTGAVPLTNATVTDTLNSNLEYVANSCSNSCTVNGQVLTWNVGTLPVGTTTYTVTFQATVKNTTPTNVTSIDNIAYLNTTELNGQTPIVSLTVNHPVVARPNAILDRTQTTQNTAVTINASNNDIANAVGAKTVSSVTQPSNGSTSIVNNQIQYTPNNGYNSSSTQSLLTRRLSETTSYEVGSDDSYEASISRDGTKVVFATDATNLGFITGGNTQIVLKDLTTNTYSLVSADSNGQPGNDYSYEPFISSDGTKVFFTSIATNLVANDTNNTDDLFMKDLTTGVVSRVSTTSTGGELNDYSQYVSISENGQYITFFSCATNLIPTVTDCNQTYRKNLTTGAVDLVSTDSNGVVGDQWSKPVHISSDGNKILFQSFSTNLSPTATSGSRQLFVKDMTSGAITHISSNGGVEADSSSRAIQFFNNDTEVLFQSDATNLVVNDTNTSADLFTKNLTTGVITRISTNSTNTELDNATLGGYIDPTNKYLVFSSNANNLDTVKDTIANSNDIYLKDLTTGTTRLISLNTAYDQSYTYGVGHLMDESIYHLPPLGITADGEIRMVYEANEPVTSGNLSLDDYTNSSSSQIYLSTLSPCDVFSYTLTNSVGGTDKANVCVKVQGVTSTPQATHTKSHTLTTPQAYPGSSVTYTMNYSNSGNTPFTAATITDVLDPNLTYTPNSCAPNITTGVNPITCSYNSSTRTLTWNLGTVPTSGIGSSGAVSFQATVNQTTPTTVTNIDNQSTFRDTQSNFTLPSNIDPLPLTHPNGTVSKSHDKQNGAAKGELVTYTIPYANTGTSTFNTATITDTLDTNLVYEANSCTPNTTTGSNPITCSFNSSTNTLTWNLGTVNSGSNGTVSFQARVNQNTPSTVTSIGNTATFISNTPVFTVTTTTVPLTVQHPPVGVPDVVSTPEDTVITIPVLPNDTDPNVPLNTPTNLIICSGSVTNPTNGTITVNQDNTITYTPNSNYSGTDSFTYRACDPTNQQSNPTPVTITITPVNDLPIGNPDIVVTPKDTPVEVPVLPNDSDIETPTSNLTVCSGSVTNPTNGTITINQNNTITYTPNSNYSGTDSFTYRACDTDGGISDPVPVSITVATLEAVGIELFKDKPDNSIEVGEEVTVQATFTNPNSIELSEVVALIDIDTTKGDIVANSAQPGVIEGEKYTRFFTGLTAYAQSNSITIEIVSESQIRVTLQNMTPNEVRNIIFKVIPKTTGIGEVNGNTTITGSNITANDTVAIPATQPTPEPQPTPILPNLPRTGGGQVLMVMGVVGVLAIVGVGLTKGRK